MPFIPCGQNIGCPGTDYPISNFSSELDDTLDYVAVAFPGQGSTCVDTTVVNCVAVSYPPPLGTPTPTGCFGIGENLTQQGAAAQALQTAQTCGSPPVPGGAYSNPNPTGNAQNNPPAGGGVGNGASQIPTSGSTAGGGPGNQSFYNNTQTAKCNTCPEGTSGNEQTVQAGTFSAKTQQLADQLAIQHASQLALANCICAPDLSGDYCSSDIISADPELIIGHNAPFTIKINGSAPPTFEVAMVSATEFLVTGGPMPPGIYNFTVQVADSKNNTASVDSTVDVLGISNIDFMPDGQCLTPYSFQLIANGGKGPYTFALVNTPPNGIGVSSSGLISGIPTQCGGANLIVTVTDSTGRKCTNSGDIVFDGPCVYPLEGRSVGYFFQIPGSVPPVYGLGAGALIVKTENVTLCAGQSGPINIELTIEYQLDDPTCQPNATGGVNCPRCNIQCSCGGAATPGNNYVYDTGKSVYTGTFDPNGNPQFYFQIQGQGTGWTVKATVKQV